VSVRAPPGSRTLVQVARSGLSRRRRLAANGFSDLESRRGWFHDRQLLPMVQRSRLSRRLAKPALACSAWARARRAWPLILPVAPPSRDGRSHHRPWTPDPVPHATNHRHGIPRPEHLPPTSPEASRSSLALERGSSDRHRFLGFAASARLPTCVHSQLAPGARPASPTGYSPELTGHMPLIDFCNRMDPPSTPPYPPNPGSLRWQATANRVMRTLASRTNRDHF